MRSKLAGQDQRASSPTSLGHSKDAGSNLITIRDPDASYLDLLFGPKHAFRNFKLVGSHCQFPMGDSQISQEASWQELAVAPLRNRSCPSRLGDTDIQCARNLDTPGKTPPLMVPCKRAGEYVEAMSVGGHSYNQFFDLIEQTSRLVGVRRRVERARDDPRIRFLQISREADHCQRPPIGDVSRDAALTVGQVIVGFGIDRLYFEPVRSPA